MESFFVTLLSGLKQLKGIFIHFNVWKDIQLDQETLLDCFKKHGTHLQDAGVTITFSGLELCKKSINYVLEKT
jgi:hypothetical protein